jgi:hypothetical protein
MPIGCDTVCTFRRRATAIHRGGLASSHRVAAVAFRDPQRANLELWAIALRDQCGTGIMRPTFSLVFARNMPPPRNDREIILMVN